MIQFTKPSYKIRKVRVIRPEFQQKLMVPKKKLCNKKYIK